MSKPGPAKQHSRPEVKVSILMPVFNAESTLHECLQSICKQSLTDYELIAIDDNSTDNSLAILKSFDDPRIRVFENQGKGIVSALNMGLGFCRSDLVARMDADDVMYQARLEKQLQLMLLQPSLTLCATQARKFPEDAIRAGFAEYMRWQNACLSSQDISEQIYIESPFVHPTVMFRKHRVIELGAYRDGEFPEDYELWLRLFHAGESMMKIDQVLLDWRESDSRLSRTSSRYSTAAFEQLRADYLARDPRLQNREIVFWGAGRKTRQRSSYLIDNGIRPSAWIDIDSKKAGNEYHGAKTYMPDWLQQLEHKPLVLNYVRNHGAREKCRQFLDNASYVMGRDYLDVA
ncbi:MAG: glycosyltransferase [Gammaproteobacteria bacterium]|nr:glycosyltransferase [Gammaproteobacteria bacterium]NNJ50453.1 glycosyltransferase [Gammaproteobacteria bacterium]